MTSGNSSKPNAKPEELATALKEVLDYITPLIEGNPKAVYEAHCPQDLLLDGTKDDIWRDGQKNGEVYAARQILSILNQALGIEPKTPRREPIMADWQKGLFPDL